MPVVAVSTALMLLVVTSRPRRLTLTGGLVPSLEAITRLRTCVVDPAGAVRFGSSRVFKMLGSAFVTLDERDRRLALSTPTTSASKSLRLLLRSARFCGVALSVFRAVVSTLPSSRPLPL